MNFLDDAEPFRIKMVEPIRKTTREEREKLVKAADFNIFKIPAENVFIDMLTDSPRHNGFPICSTYPSR